MKSKGGYSGSAVGWGMAEIRRNSAWGELDIERFLNETVIPIRLACETPGGPLVSSLWFRYADGRLWCATQKTASITSRIAANPAVGFEIAGDQMPYSGVRGQGAATLVDDAGMDTLLLLIDRYLGTRESGFAQWLISNATNETAICIEPDWLTSWDFSSRMAR